MGNPERYLYEVGATNAIRILLRYIEGLESSEREGLQETPARVMKAYQEWFSGYGVDPADLIKSFRDGAEHMDESSMVVQCGIPFYSHCEHHMAPFFGVVHIGYIPNGTILGLSKFKRLVDVFSRRLQVQERLQNQIASALMEALDPRGVAVIVEARHMCMESRGVNTSGTVTKTMAIRGVFTELAVRNEFLQHVDRG